MTILTDGEITEPTMAMRWAKCGTERVLQQMFVTKRCNASGGIIGMSYEWRNIPERALPVQPFEPKTDGR